MCTRGRTIILGAAAVAVLFGATAAYGLPIFMNTTNRLIGDPRRGTEENYTNTPAYSYHTPRTILGGGALDPLGSVPGQYESLRGIAGSASSAGINIGQPMKVNPATDPARAAIYDPNNLVAGYAIPQATGLWGVRSGAAVQWQTNQDGSSIPLLPNGVVSGQAYNLTPSTVYSTAVGIGPGGLPAVASPVNDGLAPNSFAELGGAPAGIADFVPWLIDASDPTKVVTGFGVHTWDTNAILTRGAAAFGAANVGQVISALVGRVDLFEGGALFDQVAGAFDETNFDFTGGTNGMAGDELNDAVDGVLLLTGSLENVTITNTWFGTLDVALFNATGQIAAVAGSVTRRIDIKGDVYWDGGSLFNLLVPDLPGPDGILGTPDDLSLGSFSASYTNLPFTNATGADPNLAAYDFIGGPTSTYSADLSFTTIPEPLTMLSGFVALLGLGGYVRRRAA